MEKQKANYNFVKGSAKEAPFSKDGSRIRVSLLIDALLELVEQHPELHTKGYVNVELIRRSGGPDNYGNTHMVIETTFVPGEKKASVAESRPVAEKVTKAKEVVVEKDEDDLPF